MKNIFLLLLLTCVALPAQTPPTATPPNDTQTRPPRSPLTPAALPQSTPQQTVISPSPQAVAAAQEPEEILPAGMINFQATDINQVLQIYAELVGKTLLRPANLPSPPVTLKTQTSLTKREAIQALDTVLGMNGIAIVPIGDKFLKVVPSVQAGQEGGTFSRQDESQLPLSGQYVSQIVQLRYSKPSELLPVLQPFSKIPNGLLPVDSSQILVIRDYSENLKRMLEMIKEIDVSVPSEYTSEVIPIKYALASEIANALNSLSSGGGGGVTVGRGTATSNAPRPGSTTGAGSTTTGYRAPNTVNPLQTNPGGTTTPGATTGAGGAGSFTDRLRTIIQRASASGDFQVLGQTKIIADERTNSLLIFAGKQDMDMIKDIISKLDVVLAQVLIESVILEVTLQNGQQTGVSYLQRAQEAGSFTGIGAIRNNNLLTPENFVSVGTNGLGNIQSGFSYLATWGDDLDVTVTALATDSRINVLSRPRIQTSHAVPATLFIGNTVPYITGTTYGDFSGASTRSVYQEKRVGITLDVLPLINPDGLVVMDISENVQQLGNDVIIDGNPVPTTTERSASAKVAVHDRDTIILGGFISTSQSKSASGVPLLKDIPLLGVLFRANSDNRQRVELIVLMRPTVLPTPEIAALTATAERAKMPATRQAEADINKEEAKRIRNANRKLSKDTSTTETVSPAVKQNPSRQEPQFLPVEGIE